MKKSELKQATAALFETTKDALQLIWDNTNKGQRNKLLKNTDIKALLERYGVVTDGND